MAEKNEEIAFLELIRMYCRRWRYILLWVTAGALAGILLTFAFPKEYTSNVKMISEADSQPLFGSNTEFPSVISGKALNVESGYMSVKLYPEIIKTVPFVFDLSLIEVKSPDPDITVSLYDYVEKQIKPSVFRSLASLPSYIFSGNHKGGEANTPNPAYLTRHQEDVINAIRKRINITIDDNTGVILVSVTMQDPSIAAAVADSLVNRLGKYIVRYRTAKSIRDCEFIEGQYEEAKDKYFNAQHSYARYIDRNSNIRQESVRIEALRLNNEQMLAYELYVTLAKQLETAKIKVRENTTSLHIIEPARIPVRSSNMGKSTMALIFAAIGGLISVLILSLKHTSIKYIEEEQK